MERGDTQKQTVERLLAEGRAAEALEAADGLESSEVLARIWLLVGNVRALRALAGSLDGPLRARVDAVIQRGLELRPVPSGEYDALSSTLHQLAEFGLAHDLVLHHLALAEVAPRVDWRVLHVEHAATLAGQLDDPGLLALVTLFQARLAAFLGEDDEARDYALEAQSLAVSTREPRASAIAALGALMSSHEKVSDRELKERCELMRLAGVTVEQDAWGLSVP